MWWCSELYLRVRVRVFVCVLCVCEVDERKLSSTLGRVAVEYIEVDKLMHTLPKMW
jgi:hypothetical protein